MCQPVRQSGGEGAERGAQGAQHAVACEQCGSCVGARGARKPRMLQRQEHAHVAGTRVEGADEGDDQHRPERGLARKAQPGGGHQDRRGAQQPVGSKPVAPGAHHKSRQRGTQHRGGAYDTHLQGVESDCQQIGRQQHCHVPVAKRTQPTCRQQQRGFGINTIG